MKTKTRQYKFNRQKGLCYYCKEPMNLVLRFKNPPRDNDATYEHVIPRCLGGSQVPYNKVLVHHKCNQRRGRVLQSMRYAAMGSNDKLQKECEALKKECESFDDAMNYVDDIILDLGCTHEEVVDKLKELYYGNTKGND